MNLSNYVIKSTSDSTQNPCHLCCLAEKEKRVTHTTDGRYKSHTKWKCTLLHEGCPLGGNEYFIEQ